MRYGFPLPTPATPGPGLVECSAEDPAPPGPELVECSVEEATKTLLEAVHGRFWADNWQDRLARMRAAGYVIAKRKT